MTSVEMPRIGTSSKKTTGGGGDVTGKKVQGEKKKEDETTGEDMAIKDHIIQLTLCRLGGGGDRLERPTRERRSDQGGEGKRRTCKSLRSHERLLDVLKPSGGEELQRAGEKTGGKGFLKAREEQSHSDRR